MRKTDDSQTMNERVKLKGSTAGRFRKKASRTFWCKASRPRRACRRRGQLQTDTTSSLWENSRCSLAFHRTKTLHSSTPIFSFFLNCQQEKLLTGFTNSPSTASSRTNDKPIELGRCGDRVEKTPTRFPPKHGGATFAFSWWKEAFRSKTKISLEMKKKRKSFCLHWLNERLFYLWSGHSPHVRKSIQSVQRVLRVVENGLADLQNSTWTRDEISLTRGSIFIRKTRP